MLGLSDEERAIVAELGSRIIQRRADLLAHDAYYEGAQRINNLGIAVPPNLEGLHIIANWPRLAVDSIEERLDVEGFRFPDTGAADQSLWDIWQENDLDEESSLAHIDSLVYGRSYVTVGTNPDSDTPLITVESPRDIAVTYDARLRRVDAALRLFNADRYGVEHGAVIYLPDQTITVEREDRGDAWVVTNRDRHNLGFAPVVRLVNRQRTAERFGSSEMADVVPLTDAAARKLLALEVSAEYFAAPQRYILGASEQAFVDPDGNAVTAWETYLGRFLAMERDENGELPSVGQFAAHDFTPYTNVIHMYAQLVASVTGMPPHYLGFTPDNPASADAIRSGEARLVKRAERKQRAFGGAWEQVMRLALLIRDGRLPDGSQRLETLWRDAATPTQAAQTDAAVKLVAAGVLPPFSDVALELIGFSEVTRERIRAERKELQSVQPAAPEHISLS